MSNVSDVLMTIAGIAILVFTWMVVVFTIVLPRGQWGPARLSTYITRGVRLVFSGIAGLTKSYERKDTILAPIGPIAVITQLLVWLALFALGVRPDARALHAQLRDGDQPGGRGDVHARRGAPRPI